MTRLAKLPRIALVGLVYLFMLAPVLIVIPVSFTEQEYTLFPPQGFTLKWYEAYLNNDNFIDATLLSIKLAVLATVIMLFIGTAAAWVLSRQKSRTRDVISSTFLMPLIIPRLVLGIALMIFFAGTFIGGSFFGLLLAHMLLILPYVIYIMGANIANLNPALTEAAESLGATRGQAFRTITLPLLKGGLVASAVLGFVQSFDELEMSLFLTGMDMSTLPVNLYHYLEFNSDPMVAAISTVVVAGTTIMVLIAERFIGLSRYL